MMRRSDEATQWGLCLVCAACFRWVVTREGVSVPVGVTPAAGGALMPVITDDGSRIVDRRRPVDGDRPGFVPHWENCSEPGAYHREQAALAAGVPIEPPAPDPRRESQLGRCAGCYRPDHVAYGRGCTGLLCPACSAILTAWRKTPAGRRPPLHYPRWKGGER